MPRRPCVYVLTNRRNGTLYSGVTSDLHGRLNAHKAGLGSEFATKWGVTRLIHAEFYETMTAAIVREKQFKAWKRAWKVALIEQANPYWRDLTAELR